uniref:Uncharacterized protein n=1 Tax=Setaria italica TaxID=4555 RepID=K3XTN9_SETIT
MWTQGKGKICTEPQLVIQDEILNCRAEPTNKSHKIRNLLSKP